jgi:hypothetical protein
MVTRTNEDFRQYGEVLLVQPVPLQTKKPSETGVIAWFNFLNYSQLLFLLLLVEAAPNS